MFSFSFSGLSLFTLLIPNFLFWRQSKTLVGSGKTEEGQHSFFLFILLVLLLFTYSSLSVPVRFNL